MSIDNSFTKFYNSISEMTQNEESETKMKIQNKAVKIIAISTSVIMILFLASILALKIYYSGRWYPNTWVGNREISGMNYEESKELLKNIYDEYKLTIQARNNGSLTIAKSDIDYEVDIQNSLNEEFNKQHESFTVFSLSEKKQLSLDIEASYNVEKLESILKNSEFIKGSSTYEITEPENAKVIFSKEKQCLIIENEVLGNTVNYDVFEKTVKESLDTGFEILDMTNTAQNPDIYVKPDVISTDEELQKEVDTCNAVTMRFLTWKIDSGVTETVEPKKIFSWCTYKNGKVTFKKMAIRNWVEKLCLRYKTVGMTRTFTNHKGKKIKVSGGDYGWAFDYEAMVKQLMNVLKKPIDPELQQAYIAEPNKENKKAITFVKEPKYSGTGYKYDYENKENDWDTKNFTEISLKDQKVYVWRKGKVVFSCPTISGLPVKDRETRKGAYFIKEHQTHRVLKGDNYATPVDYWVRITWTGTGFHGAPWQSWGSWTKTTYQTRGSHGCLNLEPANAKKIYKLTKYKEMVFIY